MARYIDADKFAEAICKFSAIDEHSANAVIFLLQKQPTADVVEVKHGEWILRRQSNGVRTHQCSVCGRPIYTIDENIEETFPYCHCGAKMDR